MRDPFDRSDGALLGFAGLERQDDLDLGAQRAHHELHVEVGAIEGEPRLEADQLLTRARMSRLTDLDCRHRDLLRYAVQREIASDLELAVTERLDRTAREADLRELLGVEEVGALDVAIAPLVVGIEAGGSDRDLDRGSGFVVGVVDQRSADVPEGAVDMGSVEVPRLEEGRGVHRINGVGAGRGRRCQGE